MTTKLDPNTITYDGVPLSRTEYLILKTLIDNKGNVVRRSQIIEKAWDKKKYGKTDSLAIHVGNIRRKIPNIPVYSVSKFGYIYS